MCNERFVFAHFIFYVPFLENDIFHRPRFVIWPPNGYIYECSFINARKHDKYAQLCT